MLTIENLRHRIGEEIAVSEWLEIDQNISGFMSMSIGPGGSRPTVLRLLMAF